MADVYLARHVDLDVDVAIKFIRMDQFPQSILNSVVKRFQNEAKKMAQLSHHNITKVTDYGVYKGTPFLVMEYLSGGTLKKYLGKPMPYREAASLLIPIAKALAYAHSRGVIHRDVKPTNILLSQTGQPMLSDFGVAKVMGSEQTQGLTATGASIGTPEYMAPEQALGKKIDQRVDVYSLGVILYELVTGRRPFIADTPMGVINKVINEPPPDPASFVTGIPEQVTQVLRKALARDREERYDDMAEFLDRLEDLITEKPPVEKKNIRKIQPKKQPAVKIKVKEKSEKRTTGFWNRWYAWIGLGVAVASIFLFFLNYFPVIYSPELSLSARTPPTSIKTATPPAAAIPFTVNEEVLTVIQLTYGTLGDKSFTDSAHRGLVQGSEEFGFVHLVNEAGPDPAKWEPAFMDAVQDPDIDVIVIDPREYMDTVVETAPGHPEKSFILFDHYIDFKDTCSECDNVYAVQYMQNEGSYLAGLYAGLMSETGMIGAVGGQDIPIIQDFMVGYIQGAKDAGLAEEDILIQFAGSWSDPAKGKELALTMYQQGADYVFQVAGGTGVGVFQAAEEAGKWAIGVDSDQAIIIEETDPDMAAVIATSMLKNVEKSLYRAMKMYYEGTLPFGTNEALGIPDGVGLAYNKFYDEYTPQDVKDKIAEAEAAVIAGDIVIDTVF